MSSLFASEEAIDDDEEMFKKLVGKGKCGLAVWGRGYGRSLVLGEGKGVASGGWI